MSPYSFLAQNFDVYERFFFVRICNVVMTNDFFRFQVMKRLMDRYEQSNGKKLTVDQYMIMFLKFFASVIPTIEYDFSSSI
jgi:hypothetical protein